MKYSWRYALLTFYLIATPARTYFPVPFHSHLGQFQRILTKHYFIRAFYCEHLFESIASDHETRRKIKTTACVGVGRYRQAGSEKSKIRAGESLLRGFLSGLHFRTDRIIQNQQIDDAASRRRHLVPIKIASAKVSPSETQPGRSGTTTVQSSFSSQG